MISPGNKKAFRKKGNMTEEYRACFRGILTGQTEDNESIKINNDDKGS